MGVAHSEKTDCDEKKGPPRPPPRTCEQDSGLAQGLLQVQLNVRTRIQGDSPG